MTFALDFLALFSVYLSVNATLNLEFGVAGIEDFGKMLFVAAGAAVGASFVGRLSAWLFGYEGFVSNNTYVVSQIDIHLHEEPLLGLSLLILTILVAGLSGAALGYLLYFPVAKLRGDYLSIFLFGGAFFMITFLSNYTPLINGNLGVSLPDPFIWAGSSRFYVATSVLALFTAGVYFYVHRVDRSPLGRLLRAVRENEGAAEAIGKNVTAIRRNILIIASGISGMTGVLYVFYTVDMTPDAFNIITWIVYPLMMIMLGGLGNNKGSFLGTFTFLLLLDAISIGKYSISGILPFDIVWLEYLLFGFLLLALLYMKPNGLLPERAERRGTKG